MTWGIFPNKEVNDTEYVYAAHSDKKNKNETFKPEIYDFHIGYIHPPFFSKFEVQLTDFIMYWIVYWFGHWLVLPIVNTLIVVIPFFMLQRTYFVIKMIYYFWYTIFISTDNPYYDEYNLSSWFWTLFLSSLLQDLIYPWIILLSIVPILNWLNFYLL